MPEPIRDRLATLVAELAADGELSDADLAAIHDAAVSQTLAIKDAAAWREKAHLHEEPHVPVITLDADGGEETDASGVRCHDCGRDLVSDAGTARILVCPTIHGRRPADLEPADPDHAVECGYRPGA